MKRIYLLLFWLGSFSAIAQPNIVRIEYFIDTDPGVGSGTAIPVAAQSINILENVPTGALSEGFHVITFRAEDEFGVWGQYETKPFYVTLSSTTSQNNIVAMEYFIDSDPGVGSGTPIAFAPMINLNVLENIPTGGLSEGFHLVTIRAQDENGVWGLSESKPFYVTQSTTTIVNNISAMEYFIDADPGRGSGVAIPIAPSTNLNILENVPTGSLSEGFHIITLRAQDENGIWGLSESKVFFVDQSSTITSNNITAIEYFIDADPGRGLGVSIPITPGVIQSVLENVPTNTLSLGFHILTVRALDEKGNWGLSESKPFYVLPSQAINLVSMEYFIDTDPGVGSGTPIVVTPSPSLNILENIPTGALSDGFHLFSVRAQDDRAQWGHIESKPFYINKSSGIITNDIVSMEYYFDTDPGYGNGFPIALTAGTSINILENINLGGLSSGIHTIHIRALDSQGVWGLTESKVFFVDEEGRRLIKYEYAIDVDPGIDLATQQSIAPPQLTINETLLIDTNPLSLGPHNLILRVQDENLFWTKTSIIPFTVCDGASVNFSADVVCEGNATTFTDLSTNVLGGDIYSWDFDSDGTVDDLTIGNTSFTYPGPGLWTASLVIDRAGCKDSLAITVEVGGIPIPDAGLAQDFCVDNTTLAAASLLPGETGQWSLISGSGILAASTDPNSIVSGLSPGINEFNWELTDPTGTCVANDIVQINFITLSANADAGPNQNVCTDNTVLAGNSPGVGETGTWSTVSGSGTFIDASDPVTTVSGLSFGLNEFQWEVMDPTGTCSSVDIVIIDYIIQAIPNAGVDQLTCFDNTQLSADPLLPLESGFWTILTGGGTISDATDPQAVISSLAPGITELLWTVTDPTGTCSQSDQIQIDFVPVTIADAGLDQSICADNTSLAANNAQLGEVSTWNLLSGTSNLQDPINPASDVNGISTSLIELEWTITDVTGICISRDTVLIQSNPPISSNPISTSVSIGDSLEIDVQSETSANIGDVLTTSISSSPEKGIATVLTDGRILYKPDIGFFGDDLITFEICNQCGNCTTNTLTVNIPNNAPVIATQDPVNLEPDNIAIAIDLASLISDINNNADLSTLRVIGSPTSGAIAIIDPDYNLQIDYGGINFSGTDEITIEVCDTEGVCATSVLSLLVDVSTETPPPIIVYNALTPNGDGKHDFLKIENISAYPENEVLIYNRIGQMVFRTDSYNNLINNFDGTSNQGDLEEVPEGTYYYILNLNGELNTSGYFVLQK